MYLEEFSFRFEHVPGLRTPAENFAGFGHPVVVVHLAEVRVVDPDRDGPWAGVIRHRQCQGSCQTPSPNRRVCHQNMKLIRIFLGRATPNPEKGGCDDEYNQHHDAESTEESTPTLRRLRTVSRNRFHAVSLPAVRPRLGDSPPRAVAFEFEFRGVLNGRSDKEEFLSDVVIDRRTRRAEAAAAARYGGADIGASLSGFFAGLGALAFAGALVAAGANELDYQLNLIDLQGEITEASIVGAAVAVVVVFLTFLFGGWVAGRMSRFAGGKNGMGAGLWLLIFAAIFALLGALVGPEFNAFATAGLPDWFSQIRSDVRTTSGLILAAVFAIAALLGGYAGGRLGDRYNEKVDATMVHATDTPCGHGSHRHHH